MHLKGSTNSSLIESAKKEIIHNKVVYKHARTHANKKKVEEEAFFIFIFEHLEGDFFIIFFFSFENY